MPRYFLYQFLVISGDPTWIPGDPSRGHDPKVEQQCIRVVVEMHLTHWSVFHAFLLCYIYSNFSELDQSGDTLGQFSRSRFIFGPGLRADTGWIICFHWQIWSEIYWLDTQPSSVFGRWCSWLSECGNQARFFLCGCDTLLSSVDFSN